MNLGLRNAEPDDAVKRFDMNESFAVISVLIAVGGGSKVNWRFDKTRMSERVKKGNDGHGLVGYLLDAQGAEVIRTLTTEQEPQAKARCERLVKMFKDAMVAQLTAGDHETLPDLQPL